MQFYSFLEKIGVQNSQNIIVHSSLKSIRLAFRNINPLQIITDLKNILTNSGSLVMPTFTYNFKKEIGGYEIFNREGSTSKTGALTEIFRKEHDVIRTSSPTHSFAIWGRINKEILESNSPKSPLGENSVLEWLCKNEDSFVLLLGIDFSSLSLLHYFEIIFKVPWNNSSPWDYLRVLPVGVSNFGEEDLIEIPGCSKSFISFEKYLEERKIIERQFYKGMKYYFIEIKKLITEAEFFFTNNYKELLCAKGTCEACDSRRNKFIGI